MLINLLKHNLRCNGVIHVGAHWAQEHDTYVKMGIKHFVYFEPCKDAYSKLEQRFRNDPYVILHNFACGQKIGFYPINVERSNQGQSNSILQMGTHLTEHPGIEFVEQETIQMCRLDDFRDPDTYDFLMIDVQGYEAEVIKGGLLTIQQMKYVYCEVNKAELYKGCPMVEEIDSLLKDFTRIETVWTKHGWGDALYKRKQ